MQCTWSISLRRKTRKGCYGARKQENESTNCVIKRKAIHRRAIHSWTPILVMCISYPSHHCCWVTTCLHQARSGFYPATCRSHPGPCSLHCRGADQPNCTRLSLPVPGYFVRVPGCVVRGCSCAGPGRQDGNIIYNDAKSSWLGVQVRPRG